MIWNYKLDNVNWQSFDNWIKCSQAILSINMIISYRVGKKETNACIPSWLILLKTAIKQFEFCTVGGHHNLKLYSSHHLPSAAQGAIIRQWQMGHDWSADSNWWPGGAEKLYQLIWHFKILDLNTLPCCQCLICMRGGNRLGIACVTRAAAAEAAWGACVECIFMEGGGGSDLFYCPLWGERV